MSESGCITNVFHYREILQCIMQCLMEILMWSPSCWTLKCVTSTDQMQLVTPAWCSCRWLRFVQTHIDRWSVAYFNLPMSMFEQDRFVHSFILKNVGTWQIWSTSVQQAVTVWVSDIMTEVSHGFQRLIIFRCWNNNIKVIPNCFWLHYLLFIIYDQLWFHILCYIVSTFDVLGQSYCYLLTQFTIYD